MKTKAIRADYLQNAGNALQVEHDAVWKRCQELQQALDQLKLASASKNYSGSQMNRTSDEPMNQVPDFDPAKERQ